MATQTGRPSEQAYSHPPPSRARPRGQDDNEARQQARPEVARSGTSHKGNRKDERPIGAAGRTSEAEAPPHQGPDRISRGPRRSAAGEEKKTDQSGTPLLELFKSRYGDPPSLGSARHQSQAHKIVAC